MTPKKKPTSKCSDIFFERIKAAKNGISATQANQNTRTLTAPRLTLFNSQRAYVTVATQLAYVGGTEPEVVENVAAFRPIVNVVSTGTTLDVEATVSADRKYVNMTIRPTVSVVNGFTEYQGAVDADGNLCK